MKQRDWYVPYLVEEIASPALLVFPTRVAKNIDRLIGIAGHVDRLRPHVKTHKLPQIVEMHQKRGINKLKCATIAEAEMLAGCGVADILLAYQPVGPNPQRLIALAEAYPDLKFGCLVDNEKTAVHLSTLLANTNISLNIWIDIDNGNGRTGIPPGEQAQQLAKQLVDLPHLNFAGLHVYDGHFAGLPFEERKEESDGAFTAVNQMIAELEAEGLFIPNVVAGGSPTFPVHALRSEVDLSPGTYVFWDAGYGTICPDLPFEPAALLLSRVISKPGHNRLCVDLGHKAVASENPLDRRVRFLNAPDAKFVSQSEEHLVLELENRDAFDVGDVLFGIPWHICPTVALHQEVVVIGEDGGVNGRWPIQARNRRLTF